MVLPMLRPAMCMLTTFRCASQGVFSTQVRFRVLSVISNHMRCDGVLLDDVQLNE